MLMLLTTATNSCSSVKLIIITTLEGVNFNIFKKAAFISGQNLF